MKLHCSSENVSAALFLNLFLGYRLYLENLKTIALLPRKKNQEFTDPLKPIHGPKISPIFMHIYSFCYYDTIFCLYEVLTSLPYTLGVIVNKYMYKCV